MGLAAKYNEAPQLFALLPLEMPAPDVGTGSAVPPLEPEVAAVKNAIVAASTVTKPYDGNDEDDNLPGMYSMILMAL